jgi:hypothetical protein
MTPYGIEPATFRFVVQSLKHCDTAVLTVNYRVIQKEDNNFVYLKLRNQSVYDDVLCINCWGNPKVKVTYK